MNLLKSKKEKLICHINMTNELYFQLEYIHYTPPKLFFLRLDIFSSVGIIVWSFQHGQNMYTLISTKYARLLRY